MAMFGAAHLDCVCDDNSCSACKWIEDYYNNHPELKAPGTTATNANAVSTRNEEPEKKPEVYKPQPFVRQFDTAMRAVPARPSYKQFRRKTELK